MGWIEAKKMCELKESRLVVIETERERDDILEHVIATQGRQRSRCAPPNLDRLHS
jgi:hypothetical protein